jgi:Putative MetA-pathway of phenol degradation
VTRALALLLILGGVARAQEASTGIAADRFVPGVGPLALAGAEAAETTPVGTLSCALALSGVGGPLRLKNALTGAAVSTPVRWQVSAIAALETGLWRRIAAAVIVPIVLAQDGDRLRGTGDDRPLGAPTGGDLAVRVKAAFVGDPARPGLHLAAALQVTVPLGGDSDFAATSGVTVEPRVVLDLRYGRLVLALDAGARFATDRKLFTSQFGDELVWIVGASYGVIERERVGLTAIGEAAGAVGPSDEARPVELRAAGRLRLGPIAIDLGGGAGVDGAVGAPAWRAFAVVRGALPLRID